MVPEPEGKGKGQGQDLCRSKSPMRKHENASCHFVINKHILLQMLRQLYSKIR
jgi:hypothetical protein